MSPSAVPDAKSGAPNQGLSAEQLQSFRENGYLIIPDALDPATVKALLSETNSMLEGFSLAEHPMTKFSTGEGGAAHVGDDYFLESGDKIRFFFEEDAFDPQTSTLIKPKHRAINKIGHYLHALSEPFAQASVTSRNAGIARSLGFRDPRILQSMVICKQPEIGGRVPPHQDSTFLYTNPPSAVGFWYALEDCTSSNGCLSFAKGSHKRAPITQRFVRTRTDTGTGTGTGFEDVVEGQARFPPEIDGEGKEDDGKKNENEEEEEEEEEVYTMGEVKAGSLVLIHGNILHKSEKNTSPKSRFIYTFHVIEGEYDYDAKNWLQPPQEGFTKL